MGRLGSDLASCCYVSGKRKRGATRNKTSGTTCFAFVDSSPHASPVCRLGLVGQIGPPLLVTQVCPKKTFSSADRVWRTQSNGGFQSSGGKTIGQNWGAGRVNSIPMSALP